MKSFTVKWTSPKYSPDCAGWWWVKTGVRTHIVEVQDSTDGRLVVKTQVNPLIIHDYNEIDFGAQWIGPIPDPWKE